MPRRTRNTETLRTGRDFPFAVRKVPYDALWHVMYYERNSIGVYETYDRVSKAQALRASKILVCQDGLLPKGLRHVE
jgi:hypothetical protein